MIACPACGSGVDDHAYSGGIRLFCRCLRSQLSRAAGNTYDLSFRDNFGHTEVIVVMTDSAFLLANRSGGWCAQGVTMEQAVQAVDLLLEVVRPLATCEAVLRS